MSKNSENLSIKSDELNSDIRLKSNLEACNLDFILQIALSKLNYFQYHFIGLCDHDGYINSVEVFDDLPSYRGRKSVLYRDCVSFYILDFHGPSYSFQYFSCDE